MTNLSKPVADDMVVEIDYTLRLDDGDVIDSSAGTEPLAYLHGHGNIVPGLEQALSGMQVGDEKDVTVAPEDGYGEYDDQAVELVPRTIFPDDLELTQGMELHMRDANTQQVVQVYVDEIRSDGVVLDLNHPLAGETLLFHVKVKSVRPATEIERDHGHVHGEGSHQ